MYSPGSMYKRAFSTIELLIALAVSALVLSAVLMLSFDSQMFEADSGASMQALSLASGLLAQEDHLSRTDFNLVEPATTTVMVGELAYAESIGVQTQTDFLTKKVTATISWSGAYNRSQQVSLSTYITNFENVSGAGTCDAVLSGNWKTPGIVNTQQNIAQIIGDTTGVYTITGLEAYHGLLYVTASNGSSNKETFFIFTINSANLTLLAKLDNDTANNTGLMALTIASSTSGQYAFVASASSFTKGQLQVIKVSAPANPKVVATYKIPVTNVPTSGAGNTIFYENGYVFLGLTKTSLGGNEFNIIDVHDPLHPVWVGGYSIGNDVNALYINGTTAYIASPNTQNLLALNISNPANPTLAGSFTPSGGSNGKALAVLGNTVYLGRTFGTNELYIVNANNPTNLAAFGSKDIGTGSNTTIRGIVVRSNLAFLLTNTQLGLYDISNPTVPTLYTSALTLPGGTTGVALSCEGNTLYAASNDATNHGFISVIQPGL
jgi:hypothetical protein